MSRATFAEIRAQIARGDAVGARGAIDDVLSRATSVPDRIAALKLRAQVHENLKDLRAAIADLEAVLAQTPDDARAYNELGIVCADAGDIERAVAAFARATALDPAFARAWNNYANALRSAGRPEAAAEALVRATAAKPDYALAWANLGAIRRDLGDEKGAEAALERALRLDPGQVVALLALAGLSRQQGQLDRAAALYARAAQRDPRDANALLYLGGTLAERDELAGARQSFEAALARDPAMLRAVLGRHLTLPMIYESVDSLHAARREYAAGLDAVVTELATRSAMLTPDRALDEMRWSNFLLAYQGEDDRPLQERFAQAVGAVIGRRAPQWLSTPGRRSPAGDRVRVGFVSAFFRDGTVGRYFERWITDLPRERFELSIYHLQPGVDGLAMRLAARADSFVPCGRSLPSQLAPRIRAAALDVLVYPEIGMDATTFALAALRLAPVQVAAWGHPVTTGLPSIDVFLSCDLMEPPAAERHYTERLIRLPGIGTRYALPPVPADAERIRFGLPRDVPLFLCPQSLFKIHPDNDALFARAMDAAPGAHLALFVGRHPALTARLIERLSAAFTSAGVDFASRVHVLQHCGHEDYLRLNTVCDAMLDTLHWSGGNTSLDALACGLPVVTLPGRFMRGRQSAAMLQLAGANELIARDADDYVRIAARLATDRAWRNAQAARIVAGRSNVFDDPAPVSAVADALCRLT